LVINLQQVKLFILNALQASALFLILRGQYAIQHKRITNVACPIKETVATTKDFIPKELYELAKEIAGAIIEDIKTINNNKFISLEKTN